MAIGAQSEQGQLETARRDEHFIARALRSQVVSLRIEPMEPRRRFREVRDQVAAEHLVAAALVTDVEAEFVEQENGRLAEVSPLRHLSIDRGGRAPGRQAHSQFRIGVEPLRPFLGHLRSPSGIGQHP